MATTSRAHCDCGRTFTTWRGQGVHAQKCPIARAGHAAWRKAVREGRDGVQAQAARALAIEAAKREQA